MITCCLSDTTRRYGPADVTRGAGDGAARGARDRQRATVPEGPGRGAGPRGVPLRGRARAAYADHVAPPDDAGPSARRSASDRGDGAPDVRGGRPPGPAADQAHRRAPGRLADRGAQVPDRARDGRPRRARPGRRGAFHRRRAPRRVAASRSTRTNRSMGHWDPMRLEQVVSNLLSNAIKFGAGRPIEVVVIRLAKSEARLEVRDHGIGVAARAPASHLRAVRARRLVAPVRRARAGSVHRAHHRRRHGRARRGAKPTPAEGRPSSSLPTARRAARSRGGAAQPARTRPYPTARTGSERGGVRPHGPRRRRRRATSATRSAWSSSTGATGRWPPPTARRRWRCSAQTSRRPHPARHDDAGHGRLGLPEVPAATARRS